MYQCLYRASLYLEVHLGLMVNIPKTCGLKNDEDYYNNEEVYFDAMQDGILDHIEQKYSSQYGLTITQ